MRLTNDERNIHDAAELSEITLCYRIADDFEDENSKTNPTSHHAIFNGLHAVGQTG
jgi:hypothetical protein